MARFVGIIPPARPRQPFPVFMNIKPDDRKPFVVNCAFCKEPVSLTDCKVDDRGLPVHEHCYAAVLNQRISADEP